MLLQAEKWDFVLQPKASVSRILRKEIHGRQHAATLMPLTDYRPEASYRKVTVCNLSKSKLSQIDHFMRAKHL